MAGAADVARDWRAWARAVAAYSDGSSALADWDAGDERAGGRLSAHLGGGDARRRACLQAHAGAALVLRLWSRPHYRAPTFADDCAANLRNVALPGTGVPLSVFARSRRAARLFLTHGLPLACLLEAGRRAAAAWWTGDAAPLCGAAGVRELFRRFLLAPDDWCTLWRLNCNLAAWHAGVTRDEGYAMEDKLAFLRACEGAGVPVSPSIDAPRVVVKHRNEEGGLGFKSYANARHGGDWIVQPWLCNSKEVRELLPEGAPLSTCRVITASEHGMRDGPGEVRAPRAARAARPARAPRAPVCPRRRSPLAAGKDDNNKTNLDMQLSASRARLSVFPAEPAARARARERERGSRGASGRRRRGLRADTPPAPPVRAPAPPRRPWPHATTGPAQTPRPRALSCVWRAGRAGAETDHTSVLFDVDLDSATIIGGTANAHWYKLGLKGLTLRVPLRSPTFAAHPDTDRDLRGVRIPGLEGARDLVESAHARLLPGVPLVGWDLALTEQAGSCLLEVNLSCNFFKGTFDKERYFDYLYGWMTRLEELERRAVAAG